MQNPPKLKNAAHSGRANSFSPPQTPFVISISGAKKSLILNALAIAENKIMYALILIMLFVAASTDSTSASVKQRLFFITVELSGALPFTNADAAHIISDDILLTAKNATPIFVLL